MPQPTKRGFTPHRINGDTVRPYDIAVMQEELRRFLDDIGNRPHNFGKTISSQSLAASVENRIDHGLGRAALGWMVVDINADANVWRATDTSEDTSRYLVLETDAACVVDLVVF